MMVLLVAVNLFRDGCQPHKVIGASPISSNDAKSQKTSQLIYVDSHHT
jgi:hypothetical protein